MLQISESSVLSKICSTSHKSDFGRFLPCMKGWCLYSVSGARIPFPRYSKENTSFRKIFLCLDKLEGHEDLSKLLFVVSDTAFSIFFFYWPLVVGIFFEPYNTC